VILVLLGTALADSPAPPESWAPLLIAWTDAGDTPSVLVSSTTSVEVEFELRIVLGGLIFDWTQSTDVPADTTEPIPLTLPPALTTREDAIGYPMLLTGSLRGPDGAVALPARHATLAPGGALSFVERPEGRVYVASLFPERSRSHEARNADDEEDTGTYAVGAP
jgi:hypothetical protein